MQQKNIFRVFKGKPENEPITSNKFTLSYVVEDSKPKQEVEEVHAEYE
jgi:hypothetical protein